MALRVGFIGAGMMAEALAGGFDAAAVAAYSNMCCIDPNQGRMDLFKSWGVTPAGPTRNPPVPFAPLRHPSQL